MRTASVTVLADSSAGAGADRATWPASTTITTDRPWTVGRSADCDIVVDDSRVSRRHLVVEVAGPAWIIRDVSANGSWAGGVRIGPAGVAIPAAGVLRLQLGATGGPELVVAGDPESGPAGAYGPAGPTLADVSTMPTRPGPLAPNRPPPIAVGPPMAVGPPAIPIGRAPKPPRARRRRTRWLVGGLVVLLLLLVIADRVGASLASTAAVQQIVQRGQGLSAKPSVSFGGFPFLNQVVFGDYSDIAVGIDGITPPGGPRIEHVSAHLKGAHIPLSKALHNNVASIPVDHVTATVAIDFADLNAFLKTQPGQLVLAAGSNGAVQVTGQVSEDGTPITIAGSGKLQSQDGQLTVVPDNIHVSGTGLDDLIDSLGGLSGLFPPIPVPLPNLPFNLRITSVRAGSTGVLASAAADHVVLDTGQ